MVHALFVGHESRQISYYLEISSNKNIEPFFLVFVLLWYCILIQLIMIPGAKTIPIFSWWTQRWEIWWRILLNIHHQKICWRSTSRICVAEEDIYSEAPRPQKLWAELRISKYNDFILLLLSWLNHILTHTVLYAPSPQLISMAFLHL